ncbi:MAG: hypothetical protein LH631_06000 [Alkalinema sp. CAN_BIN05]|nr:hypothetical protein [Alkalinema sp. CAN_BIN05]
MTLKESVLQGIETADDKLLEELLQLIRSRTTKKSTLTLSDTIVDFFRNSPLAEAINSGELDLSRDRTIEADRFVR